MTCASSAWTTRWTARTWLRAGPSPSANCSDSRSACRGSESDGRLAVEPGARGFELAPEPEQGRLVAERGHELHGDREAGVGDAERQHHRRLAGQVEPDRERREGEDAPPVLV